MKRKILFNAVIILLSITLITAGTMLLSGRELSGGSSGNDAVCMSVSGSVTLIRRNAGYELKEGIVILAGDEIRTSVDSGCLLGVREGFFVSVGERASLTVSEDASTKDTVFIPGYGCIVCETDGNTGMSVVMGEAYIKSEGDCLFCVETYTGTWTLSIFRGSADVIFRDDMRRLDAGESAVIVDYDGMPSVIDWCAIVPDRLNDFLIEVLSDKDTCFSADTLKAIALAREEETLRAKAQQQAHDEEVLARGGTVEVIQTSEVPSPSEGYPSVPAHTCTIEIHCDTILDNMDMLTEGKNAFVPPSGEILSSSWVQFTEGESVFDVLKRACEYAGIPMEYRWYVEYSGYYVEGINSLFEFDCGAESGWMYKVNGWYPNFACSNYILRDGDVIVWNYTVHGYGRDVGCDWMQ